MNTTYLHDQAVLNAINAFWREHCYSPTLRDLMRLADVSSSSVVKNVLQRLERNGHIEIAGDKGTKRAIVPMWVKQALQQERR